MQCAGNKMRGWTLNVLYLIGFLSACKDVISAQQSRCENRGGMVSIKANQTLKDKQSYDCLPALSPVLTVFGFLVFGLEIHIKKSQKRAKWTCQWFSGNHNKLDFWSQTRIVISIPFIFPLSYQLCTQCYSRCLLLPLTLMPRGNFEITVDQHTCSKIMVGRTDTEQTIENPPTRIWTDCLLTEPLLAWTDAYALILKSSALIKPVNQNSRSHYDWFSVKLMWYGHKHHCSAPVQC